MENRGQTLSNNIRTVYVWTHLPAKTYEEFVVMQKNGLKKINQWLCVTAHVKSSS